jgi:type III pantothenate kinase
MTPHVVCDIGNTRLKWGLCAADGSCVMDAVSLPDDPEAWAKRCQEPFFREKTVPDTFWVLASVRPQRCARLEHWLLQQGYRVRILKHAAELPLEVKLPAPEKAGIDRLLNAVAARKRLRSGEPAVLIDAGSAITVDWLDEEHAFRGGAIFPGLNLMAQALHDHTALLPLVAIPDPPPDVPARDTVSAMQAGIFHTAAGGIERTVRLLVARSSVPPRIFLTGGDGPLLSKTLLCELWPWQTLEGILASVEQSV